MDQPERGSMTTAEAGRRGGMATSRKYGHEHYQEIGHKGGQKGGQRVKQLIEEGKAAERARGGRR